MNIYLPDKLKQMEAARVRLTEESEANLVKAREGFERELQEREDQF